MRHNRITHVKKISYTHVNSNHLQVVNMLYSYFTLLLQIMKKSKCV